jgi:hypothetical protein
VIKVLQQELTHPSLGCMPPYCLGWKFDSNDDTVIVLEVTSRRIIFILQDMGAGIISGQMLKNPPGNEKTKISI